MEMKSLSMAHSPSEGDALVAYVSGRIMEASGQLPELPRHLAVDAGALEVIRGTGQEALDSC